VGGEGCSCGGGIVGGGIDGMEASLRTNYKLQAFKSWKLGHKAEDDVGRAHKCLAECCRFCLEATLCLCNHCGCRGIVRVSMVSIVSPSASSLVRTSANHR